jgi:quercetin 2,3-dioxygenase
VPILETRPLGFPWETLDPFLFCVHHDDAYPAGEENMGPPRSSLVGRDIGQDFTVKDGFRMYHGDVVPGFPQHPHRGFETVTIVKRGFIDHSDSLGATARFGAGDVQWLTAGAGIVHSEMFPLLARDAPNPLELFQIWLNLPRSDKLVKPYFTMLWSQDIPVAMHVDEAGRKTTVTMIAGGAKSGSPPPSSWASRKESAVAIWTIHLEPGARWTLPPTEDAAIGRTLYFHRGESVLIDDTRRATPTAFVVQSNAATRIEAGAEAVELLLLQGRPIGEPVAHQGPFVMNTRAELEQAMRDYRQTRFGGWPFASDAPVHPRDAGRFAKHADGRIERF